MKPQTRPVIVEVKRKRGIKEQGRSIWSGIDLSAVNAGIKAEAEESSNGLPVDSAAQSTDVENKSKAQVENMPDPQEADAAQGLSQGLPNGETAEPKKSAAQLKKAKAEPKQRAAKKTPKPAPVTPQAETAPVRGKRKIYSKEERARKLAQIGKAIRRGDSIKSAVGQERISEQTYYHWKKAATPASTGGELQDLVALEAENMRLKKLLADHLRKENAELRKRLGQA